MAMCVLHISLGVRTSILLALLIVHASAQTPPEASSGAPTSLGAPVGRGTSDNVAVEATSSAPSTTGTPTQATEAARTVDARAPAAAGAVATPPGGGPVGAPGTQQPLPAARFSVYGDVSTWANVGAKNNNSAPSGEAISGGLRVELPTYSIDVMYRRGSISTVSAAGDAATQIVSPRTAQNSFTIAGQYLWPLSLVWSRNNLPSVYTYGNIQFGSADWSNPNAPDRKLPGVVFGASLGQRLTWDTAKIIAEGNSAALSIDIGLTYRSILGQIRSEIDQATLNALLNTRKRDYFGGELFARVRVNKVEVGGGLVLLFGDNVAGVTKGQFLPFASVTVPIELAKIPQEPSAAAAPTTDAETKPPPEVHLQ